MGDDAIEVKVSDDVPPSVVGLAWMLLTGVLFVGVTVVVKHVGQAVPAPQAAFLRYLLGLVFVLPMIRPMLRARLGRGTLGLALLRGLAHGLGVMLWFFAMTRLPVAEVTAMNYLSPVWVSLGAAALLGERLPLGRVLAIAAALAGVLVILRPGFREVSAGHLAMLGTAVLFAAGYLMAKRLTAEISPAAVVGLLSLIVPAVLAPAAFAVWVPPRLVDLTWLTLVAALATAGHYTMTRAFAVAPVSATQPVTFLQLVWAAILGWLLFGEAVDPWVVAGGGLIVGAVTLDAIRQGRAHPAGADHRPTAAQRPGP